MSLSLWIPPEAQYGDLRDLRMQVARPGVRRRALVEGIKLPFGSGPYFADPYFPRPDTAGQSAGRPGDWGAHGKRPLPSV